MHRAILALCVLVPLAFAAGRWSQADDEAPEEGLAAVRAQAYSIVWADSALDLSHGGGRRVHEIYFPDLKVAATVVFEAEYVEGDDPKFVTRPRIHVFRADGPRSDLTGIGGGEVPARSEITVVLVPADLAQAIGAFAKLSDTYRLDGLRLGTDLTDALKLTDLGAAR